MRERAQREARRKAEQEAIEMERARAEEEQRLVEEDRRRRAEKRAAAAGVAGDRGSGGDAGYRSSGSAPAAGQRISDNSQRSGERTSGGDPSARPIQGRGRGGSALGGGETAAASRPRPNVAPPAPRPVPPSGRTAASQSQPGPSAAPPPAQSSSQQAGETVGRRTQSTFPHAFERWETLSSHWEGLTSFWIRRLEENSNEIQRDPLSSQLSRQVTDLSAAGANLFHAVVELQRLRASSERKFQRWFFETRAEQERAQEMQAQLEAVLAEERRGRAEAIADAVAREGEKSSSDKRLEEMKRELLISKEEARRAWEELGRREQEERERTISLREGQPTLVGGVQVVPMMQGVPSRHGSTAARPTTSGRAYDPSSEQARPQGSGADPFVSEGSAIPSSGVPTYPSAPAVQPASTSGAFYQQHQGTTLHPTDPAGSEGTYSEGDIEYEIEPSGQFRRDSRGHKIPYTGTGAVSDDDTDEFEASERAREIAHLQQYGHAPVTSAEGSYPSTTAGGAGRGSGTDYSGQGYGSGPGWEEVPRHHHPTRLSDVLEEDEHSRTSASMVSRSRD